MLLSFLLISMLFYKSLFNILKMLGFFYRKRAFLHNFM